MKLIAIAFVYDLAYHTLRCVHAAGHEIHVLGRATGRGLRFSRLCASYRGLAFDPERDPLAAAVAEILRRIAETGAELVIPTDILSTRLLIAIRHLLPVGTSLLPDAELFDSLNDKRRFAALCEAHGVVTPETRLFADGTAVIAAVAEGELRLPFVVKPVIGMGGLGVELVRSDADLARVATHRSAPLLVQRLIEGRDRDISILARDGKLLAYGVQVRDGNRFDFADSAALRDMIVRFIAAVGYEGLAHFDAVEEAGTGDFYLIECNPRSWASVFALAAAGVNMVAMSIEPPTRSLPIRPPPVVVPIRKALVQDLIGGRWSRGALRMARYYLADPVGVLADYFKLFDDEHATVGGMDEQLIALAKLTGAAATEPAGSVSAA